MPPEHLSPKALLHAAAAKASLIFFKFPPD
jgi:hypothetical protein